MPPHRYHKPRNHYCRTPNSAGCRGGFKSLSGLTHHRNSAHPAANRHAHLARTPSPLQEPDNVPEQPEDPPIARQTKLHPILSGMLHDSSFRVLLATLSYVFTQVHHAMLTVKT
jgi:hypothetical protein